MTASDNNCSLVANSPQAFFIILIPLLRIPLRLDSKIIFVYLFLSSFKIFFVYSFVSSFINLCLLVSVYLGIL